MDKVKNNITASTLLGIFFSVLTVVSVLFCDDELAVFSSREPLVNCWSTTHLLFGLSLFFVVYTLIKYRDGLVSVPLFILVLWEIFEYKEYPNTWIKSLGNNFLDVLIGLLGIYVGALVMKRLNEK